MVCNSRKVSPTRLGLAAASPPQPARLLSPGEGRSPATPEEPCPQPAQARSGTISKLCLLTVGLLSSGASEPTAGSLPSLPQPLPAADATHHLPAATRPTTRPSIPQPSQMVDGVEFSPAISRQSARLISFQPEQSGGQTAAAAEPLAQPQTAIGQRYYRPPLPEPPRPDWSAPDALPDAQLLEFATTTAHATASTTRHRPQSGAQLYHQRRAALQAGSTYTRLPTDSFAEAWLNAPYAPDLQDWHTLLSQEAKAISVGQGNNALTVMLGDSISLWYPRDFLPQQRFWLNQAISGDTAQGMLKRLSLFDSVRPDQIHVMAGINDLRQGATDGEVLERLEQIMQQLRQRHPDAQVVVHSILPTRLPSLPTQRIQGINRQLAAIAKENQVTYVDLHSLFLDRQGQLQRELTTDGLHLSLQGYAVWYAALRSWGLA